MHTRIPVAAPKHLQKTLRADASGLVVACEGVNGRLPACRIAQCREREMAGSGLTVAQLGAMTEIAAAPDDAMGALAWAHWHGHTGAEDRPRTIDAFAQFA